MVPKNGIVAVILFLTVATQAHTAHAQFNWLFGPKDFESCAEDAATRAQTAAALKALEAACDTTFPARRSTDGGYELCSNPVSTGWVYSTMPRLCVRVSSPRLTPSDWATKKQAEKEFVSFYRRELEKITVTYAATFCTTSLANPFAQSSGTCISAYCATPMPDTCLSKDVRVDVRNGSETTVHGLVLSYGFSESADCRVQNSTVVSSVRMPPGGYASFALSLNITGYTSAACARVTGFGMEEPVYVGHKH